jgi:hypothetical protein
MTTTPPPTSPPTAPPTRRPLWVRFVLLGASRRPLARKCVWILLFLAVCCAAATLWYRPIVGAAALFMLGAILYDRAIAWVDRFGTWK